MREVEAKILEVDRPAIEEKLRSIGARKIGEQELEAVYYDYDGKEAYATLRIRREDGRAVLCHKQPLARGGVKENEETEVEVSDFEAMHRILLLLGMHEERRIRKRRISYALGNVRFEFDQFLGADAHVPEFLEIEAPDEETVYAHAKLLGIPRERCLPWNGKDVIAHYAERA